MKMETKETEKEVKEEVKEIENIVVSELPTLQTRMVSDEQGKEYNCLTINEALADILSSVKKIEKAVA
jgi:hypothetical protein